ncbi:hypothetical protein ACTGW3_13070, partial [Streptococcus suis]
AKLSLPLTRSVGAMGAAPPSQKRPSCRDGAAFSVFGVAAALAHAAACRLTLDMDLFMLACVEAR